MVTFDRWFKKIYKLTKYKDKFLHLPEKPQIDISEWETMLVKWLDDHQQNEKRSVIKNQTKKNNQIQTEELKARLKSQKELNHHKKQKVIDSFYTWFDEVDSEETKLDRELIGGFESSRKYLEQIKQEFSDRNSVAPLHMNMIKSDTFTIDDIVEGVNSSNNRVAKICNSVFDNVCNKYKVLNKGKQEYANINPIVYNKEFLDIVNPKKSENKRSHDTAEEDDELEDHTNISDEDEESKILTQVQQEDEEDNDIDISKAINLIEEMKKLEIKIGDHKTMGEIFRGTFKSTLVDDTFMIDINLTKNTVTLISDHRRLGRIENMPFDQFVNRMKTGVWKYEDCETIAFNFDKIEKILDFPHRRSRSILE